MECTLLLAEGCNLECEYCYEGKKKSAKLLNEETAEKALDFICKVSGENCSIDLVLLGGEPLLNKPVFFKVLNLIKNKYQNRKFNIEMTTNGLLLDPSVLDAVFDMGIDLSISLDGTKYTNNLNRKMKSGDNYYEKVIHQIKILVAENRKFNIRMTVTPNNVQYFMENIRFFWKIGIDRIYIGFDEFTNWSNEDLINLDSQMTELDEFYLTNIVNNRNKIINLYDFKTSTFIAKREIAYCSAGTDNHFVIDCEGNIYPCNYVIRDCEWVIGNINKGINRSKFAEMIKKHLKRNREICYKCNMIYSCNGNRCGFKNYSLTGYLDVVSTNTCNLEKILFQHNFYVFSAMFKQREPRFMDLYNYAKEHNIEITDFIRNLEEEGIK